MPTERQSSWTQPGASSTRDWPKLGALLKQPLPCIPCPELFLALVPSVPKQG